MCLYDPPEGFSKLRYPISNSPMVRAVVRPLRLISYPLLLPLLSCSTTHPLGRTPPLHEGIQILSTLVQLVRKEVLPEINWMQLFLQMGWTRVLQVADNIWDGLADASS